MIQPVRSYGCSSVWITPNMRGSLNINVQKEFNKGHQGAKTPKNERLDYVHDYKPKPNKHPNDPNSTERQPGRAPKRNELKKDFGL